MRGAARARAGGAAWLRVGRRCLPWAMWLGSWAAPAPAPGPPVPGARDPKAQDAQDPTEDPAEVARLLDGRAFVTVEPRVDTAYPGQLVPVEITLGVEADFLERDVLQVFRRAVDLPLQLDWGEAPGLRPWPAADEARAAELAGDPDLRSLSLGDELARAPLTTEARGARTFRVLRLVRHLIPSEAGVLPLPEARLRLAFATRFREDWLQGRVPLDRHEAELRAVRHSLLVLALPTVGRPDAFTGAVGPLTLSARLTPERVERGGTVRLELELRGPGDLRGFPAPALDLGDRWGLLGTLEGGEPGLRRITYELAPRVAGDLAPPTPSLWVFEPLPAPAYRELRATLPVVRVEGDPDAGAPGAGPAGAEPEDPEVARARTSSRLLAWGLFAVASLFALLLLGARRAREDDAPAGALPPRPRPPFDRDPLATLRGALAGDASVAAADHGLRRYLAVRLGLAEATVGPDSVRAGLEARGVPAEPVERALAALLELRRRRFADGPAAGAEAPLPDVVAVAAELEARLAP